MIGIPERPAGHLTQRELAEAMMTHVPDEVYQSLLDPPPGIASRMCRLDGDPAALPHVLATTAFLQQQPSLPPFGLLPLLYLDEASYAAVVCAPSNALPPGTSVGSVVRCYVTPVEDRHQMAILDTSAVAFLQSLNEELQSRQAGLEKLDSIATDYQRRFGKSGEVPRAIDVRPIRLACQNVVVGVGAFRHDRATDALQVPVWQTCEVPHVVAHEGNRAMAALMLCDAFQSGGTMEIDFGDHPERRVPASLRRFGRTRGVVLGAANQRTISPAESRELMNAVTPMPPETKQRLRAFCEWSGTSSERVCYLLLSGVWSCIELDYLVNVATELAPSILNGGTGRLNRIQHQREIMACRAASAVGLLHKRLSNATTASEGHDALEDRRIDIGWTLHGNAVTLWRRDGHELPELGSQARKTMTALPSTWPGVGIPTPEDTVGNAVLLIPRDMNDPSWSGETWTLPATINELDRASDSRLMRAKVGRK